mgnify:CR=1 FL=1
MAIHGLFDVGKVAEIFYCTEEAPYVDKDVLGFLLKDEFDPSGSDLNASTSTDEAVWEIAIALQEEQKPPVLLEMKTKFQNIYWERSADHWRHASIVINRKEHKMGSKKFFKV